MSESDGSKKGKIANEKNVRIQPEFYSLADGVFMVLESDSSGGKGVG